MILKCPFCQARSRASDALAGKRINCPACGNQFVAMGDRIEPETGSPGRAGKPPPKPPETYSFADAADALDQSGGVRNAVTAPVRNTLANSLPPADQGTHRFADPADRLTAGAAYDVFPPDGPGQPPGGGTPPAPGGDNDPVYLLQQIRDAVRALSGGYNPATGQNGPKPHGKGIDDDETKKFWSKAGGAEDLVTLLAQPSAGESQSASNLGGFVRNIAGIAKKRLRGLGGQKLLSTHAAHIPDPTANKPGRGRGGQTPPGGKSPAPAEPAAGDGAKVVTEATAGRSWAAMIGKAAGGVAALGAAALEAGKAVYAFARSQEKEIRRLAEVGGAQAAGIAMLDVGRIKRDIKTASETGGSSQALTAALDKFEDKLQPIEALFTNLGNTVGAKLLTGLAEVVGILGDVAKEISAIGDQLGLWQSEENKRDLKKLPAAAIGRFAASAAAQNAPQWPSGPVGAPGVATISNPFHGGP